MSSSASTSLREPLLSAEERLSSRASSATTALLPPDGQLATGRQAGMLRGLPECAFMGVSYFFLLEAVAVLKEKANTEPSIEDVGAAVYDGEKLLNGDARAHPPVVALSELGCDLESMVRAHLAGKSFRTERGGPVFGQPSICVSRPSRNTSLQEVLSAIECWVQDSNSSNPDAQETTLAGLYLWIEGMLGDITAEHPGALEEVASEDGSLFRHIKQVGTMLLVLDPWQPPTEPRALCLWEVHCSTMTGASLHIAMSRSVRSHFQSVLIKDYEACFKALMDLDLIRWARTDPSSDLAQIVIQMVECSIGLPQLNEMLHLRLMNFVQDVGLRALEDLRGVEAAQEDRCRLQDSLARFLREKGQTSRAEQLYVDLMDICSKQFGSTAPLTLQCVNQLAVTYQKMGNVRQACMIHQDLLAKRRETLGENHADTLQTMSNLAVLLTQSQEENDMAQGRELYKMAVNGRRSIAPTNPSTFYTISNYARFLSEHGNEGDDWPHAEKLHSEAAQALQTIVGPGHPLTLMAMQGECEHRVKAAKAKLRDAVADLETVVTGRREKLGKEHKDTKVSASLLRVVRYVQGAFADTNVIGRIPSADASEGWKSTLELVTPSINTAVSFRKCRAQVRALSTEKIRRDLGAFVSARGFLTTSEVPFNLFARYAAGVEKLTPDMAEAQELLGHYRPSFMIVLPEKEFAEHWASSDPSWVGQAAMSKNHTYLTLKDLSWQWFNICVFGMFDNLEASIEMLKNMKSAALQYCAQDKRWSSNIGLYVNALSDINSFHVHIVDLDWTGPSYLAAAEKILPLEAAIKVLEEEYMSSTSHQRRDPFGSFAAAKEDVDQEASIVLTETEVQSCLDAWPAEACSTLPWQMWRWSSLLALHEQVICVALFLGIYSYVLSTSVHEAGLQIAACAAMAVNAAFVGSASLRLGYITMLYLISWFTLMLLTNPYRAAVLTGNLHEASLQAYCLSAGSSTSQLWRAATAEDCIAMVFQHEVQLLMDLIGLFCACVLWLPVRLVHSFAASSCVLGLFVAVGYATQAPMHSIAYYAFAAVLLLAFAEVSRGREATMKLFDQKRKMAKARLEDEVEAEEVVTSTTLGLVFHNLAMVSKLLVVAEPVSALGQQFQAARQVLRRCRSLLVRSQSMDIASLLRGMSDSHKKAAGEILEMLEGQGDAFDVDFARTLSQTERPLVRDEMSKRVSGPMGQDLFLAQGLVSGVEAPDCVGDTLNVDFLDIAQQSGNQAMLVGGVFAFNKFFTSSHLCHGSVFNDFVESIHKLYIDNPYHNEAHGIDVANACLYLAQRTLDSLPQDMLFALFIASLAHDVGHPGLNNNYFNSQKDHPLSMVYSSSILENFHVAMLNSTLLDRSRDVSQRLSKEDRNRFRGLVAELILATDMSRHFDLIKNYQSKRLDETCEFDTVAWQRLQLGMIMKASDIGHSFKTWDLHYAWSCRVQVEFFAQGDLERANVLHISPVCDRHTVQFAKGQIGFITFCVKPLLTELIENVRQQDGLDDAAETAASLSEWEANVERWKTQTDPPFAPASNARQQELLWASYTASRRVQEALSRAHLMLNDAASGECDSPKRRALLLG